MVLTVKEKGQNGFSAMRRFLTSSYASLVSRIVLGGVFLFAGVIEILDLIELFTKVSAWTANGFLSCFSSPLFRAPCEAQKAR